MTLGDFGNINWKDNFFYNRSQFLPYLCAKSTTQAYQDQCANNVVSHTPNQDLGTNSTGKKLTEFKKVYRAYIWQINYFSSILVTLSKCL